MKNSLELLVYEQFGLKNWPRDSFVHGFKRV